jgi:hypothetical protein
MIIGSGVLNIHNQPVSGIFGKKVETGLDIADGWIKFLFCLHMRNTDRPTDHSLGKGRENLRVAESLLKNNSVLQGCYFFHGCSLGFIPETFQD